MQFIKNAGSVDDTLQKVKEGDESLLKELYEANRKQFINWFLKNHKINRNEAIDLYQKTFTTFYFNVKDGKVNSLNSNIPTYLFGIGKNLAKELFRSKKKTIYLDGSEANQMADDGFLKKHNDEHQQKLVRKILNQLGEPCKSLLIQYYFNNFSLESIASNLGYKNENVAKKKKCICLQKIRAELNGINVTND